MATVKTGAGKLNKFDLGKNHITTHDFGTILPVDCRLMLPNDEFNIRVSEFTRLMPMPVPTYGKVTSINRCFFVPCDDVMRNFDDFLNGGTTEEFIDGMQSSVTPAIPFFYNHDFVFRFINDSQLCTSSTEANYDIKVYKGVLSDVPQFEFYKLTWSGRKILQWLKSLGYNFRWEYVPEDHKIVEMSALPILCWCKFYLDWIVPSRYIDQYAFVRGLLNRNYTVENANILSNPYLDGRLVFENMIKCIYSYISDDYFTGAFPSSYGIDGSVKPADFDLSGVPGVNGTSTERAFLNGSDNDNVPRLYPGYDSNYLITYFSIQSLGVLQALVNKGKLAGTKIQDYLMYTYGIKPNDDALKISHYLGSSRSVIQIGDVMAQASTQGSDIGKTYLGQFAGKGLGGNVDEFHVTTGKQIGYMYITNELSVDSSYTQGVHIEVNALKREQFQPEYDSMGMTAIPFKELAMNLEPDALSSLPREAIDPNKPWAYHPAHAEFKSAFDVISGDFDLHSVNTGLDSWYLDRKIDSSFLLLNGYSINNNFQQAIADVNRYDKMFQVQGNDTDHFYSIFRIDISAQRALIQNADAIETDMENRQGHDIDMDLQGHLN